MNLFGSRKKPAAPQPTAPPAGGSAPAPSSQAAIARVQDAIDTLEKKEAHLQRKYDGCTQLAKDFSAKGKKPQALQELKKRKLYEKQQGQIQNQKLTLMTQLNALESTILNREMLAANREAADAIAKETASMGGVDAVDQTMDAVEDGLQDVAEIGDALSRNVGMPGLDADDDELLAELEAEVAEADAADLTEQLSKVELKSGKGQTGGENSKAKDFPDVPLPMPAAPTHAMTEEERELAELEASMAMPS